MIGIEKNINVMSHLQEQKKIAKNTVFLYIRMFVVMGVSLYTSRVVLDKLGVDNYGIYNIVGSIVVSLTFISNALTTAMRRYFSYEIGMNNADCSNIFTMNFKIQLLIIGILLILLETVGLWFLEAVINIPDGRETAASIVYQLSIVTFIFHLLQVPYVSLIVAREKMSIFAVFSVVDVLLKLLIVFMLSSSVDTDKLVLYALLMMFVSIVVALGYYLYCKVILSADSRVTKYWNKEKFRDIFSFTSWNLIGGITTVGTTEVPNYFMNYYLGVAVNAAMGVAKQVSSAIYTFSVNFQTAFNPQIVKAYAANEKDYMVELIFRTSKLSFILMFIVSLPFILCSGEVLSVWLKIVPEYTNIFCLCILLAEMINAVSAPLWMSVFAVGNIKTYQIAISIICLSVVPISWLVLIAGLAPYWILVYKIVVSIVILVYRVNYLKNKILFPHKDYYMKVVIPLLIYVPLLTMPFLYLFSVQFDGWKKILITSAVSVVVVSIVFYYIALNENERNVVAGYVRNKFIIK